MGGWTLEHEILGENVDQNDVLNTGFITFEIKDIVDSLCMVSPTT